MLGNKPPYTTMQQLNLDWILSKLKTLLRLVPDDGAVGQILRRTRDGAVWSDEQGGGGGGAVESVNGKTGAVVLDADDVGALPDDYTPPVTSVNGQTGAVVIPTGGAVDSVNGQTGTVVLDADDVGALPDDYTPPVTSVNGQTGAVVIPTGGAVDSVNGQTGTVVLDADDVGALPDDYTPPVTSVNGQTGAVVLSVGDKIHTSFLSKSVTFPSQSQGGYVLFGSKTAFSIPANATIISAVIVGFSGFGAGYGGIGTAISSDGNNIYLLSVNSGTGTFGVRVSYIE